MHANTGRTLDVVAWRLAILAIAAMAFGTGGCSAVGGARNAAQQAKCMNNLKQIGSACRIYLTQNDGKSPASLDQLVDAGLIDAEQTTCPLTGKPYVFAVPAGSAGADQLVACQPESSAPERICLLGDGSVQRLSAADFTRRLGDPRNAAFAAAFAAAGGK